MFMQTVRIDGESNGGQQIIGGNNFVDCHGCFFFFGIIDNGYTSVTVTGGGLEYPCQLYFEDETRVWRFTDQPFPLTLSKSTQWMLYKVDGEKTRDEVTGEATENFNYLLGHGSTKFKESDKLALLIHNMNNKLTGLVCCEQGICTLIQKKDQPGLFAKYIAYVNRSINDPIDPLLKHYHPITL